MKKLYVLGFAFTPKGEVVLIQKQTPDWQKGKLNGVGGRIEPRDWLTVDAMAREFREETGVATGTAQWHEFARLSFPDSLVFCFVAKDPQFRECKTTTDEKVFILPAGIVTDYDHMANVPFLLMMAWAKFNSLNSPTPLPIYSIEEL